MDSLEDAYEALRTFEILGIEKDLDISTSTCPLIAETFKSSSASLKDVSFALKSNRVLKCKIDGEEFKVLFLHYFEVFMYEGLVVVNMSEVFLTFFFSSSLPSSQGCQLQTPSCYY